MKSELKMGILRAGKGILISIFCFSICFGQEGDVGDSFLVNETAQKYSALARQYHFTNQPDSALLFYNKALAFCKSQGDNNALVMAYTSLAEFNRYTNKFDEGLRLLSEAKKIVDNEEVDEQTQLYFCNRYAAILSSVNALDPEIIKVSLKAISLANGLKDSASVASSYNEIGFVYENRRSDTCFQYYQKAFDVYQNMDGFYSEKALVAINLARNYHHAHQFERSLEYSNYVIHNLIDSIPISLKCSAYFFNNESYSWLGNFEKAYRSIMKYYYYDIEQRTRNNKKQLVELQTKYELANKELLIDEKNKELEAEKRSTAILILMMIVVLVIAVVGFILYRYTSKKNKKLEALMRENDFLTEEANHRIKNNLQLIISIIQRELLKERDKNALTGLSSVSTKIQSIASLHRQLYTRSDKEKVELKAFLEDVFENLSSLLEQHNVALQLQIPEVDIPNRMAGYIGIVLTELCTNSLKHAFLNIASPAIHIEVNIEGEEMEIIYADNGVGIEDGKSPVLVSLLCQQLQAEYFIQNKGGFHIEIKCAL